MGRKYISYKALIQLKLWEYLSLLNIYVFI